MNSTPRFRFRRPEKRAGIPHEWGTSAAPAMTREQICTLFDSATCQAYGQNTAAWDRVLELLNFSLSLQPAVAHILQQARWRTSKDPKAYVATAAWRQYQ